MNSFISSFRPLIAAAAAIVAVEAAVYAVERPDFVARSNYLDWNYLSPEYTHKRIVYEKLEDFADADPDVIQVGDSTGLYGIRPDAVMRHLGGMTYVNLSCCANTGFDGYYDIAKFVMERSRSVKVLVLYTNGLPADSEARENLDAGPARIHATFASPWALLSPPSQSLRQAVTSQVYALGGLVRPVEPMYPPGSPQARIASTVAANRGWFPEDDPRISTTRRVEVFTAPDLCGQHDVFTPDFRNDHREWTSYRRSWLGERQFVPELVLARFARLAERHQARLVIAFHPHPCAAMDAADLDVLRSMLSTLTREHRNVAIVPPSVYEGWPSYMFTSIYHVRIGYETLLSDQLGEQLATVLGIAPRPAGAAASRDREQPDVADDAPNVLGSDLIGHQWRMNGLAVAPAGSSGSAQELAENGEQIHVLQTDVSNIVAGSPYVFSIEVKPVGARAAVLAMQDADSPRQGILSCDFARRTALRLGETYDADIEDLADGWHRCWTSMVFCARAATIRLTVIDDQGARNYRGDGRSGLLVRKVRLQAGWRLLAADRSAISRPPITPVAAPCPRR